MFYFLLWPLLFVFELSITSLTALNFIADSALLRRCAFINFKDRQAAETAAAAWSNGLDFDDGTRASVKWGRSRPKKDAATGAPIAPAVAAAS